MANEKRLIDANKCYCIAKAYHSDFEQNLASLQSLHDLLDDCPTVDAVEVDVLKAWLYEIAMNNSDNYLGDACEVIIGRLNGLREFARERREGE